MFKKLKKINSRPSPFQYYTADSLWTDKHTSKQMLQYHLNESVDLSSRNKNFIEHSVEWIGSHFNLGENKKIADFGCGPGLYTNRLAKIGADVTGIDFSERSISHAQEAAEQEGLKIDYVLRNYLEFETKEKFDLITMIMCDFCALSPTQRKKILTKFYKLLKIGGSVLLDVYSLNAFDHREEVAAYEQRQLDGFWSPDDYYGFLNTFKYEDEKVILDKYTIIEEARTRIVYNWLQYFSVDSLGGEFKENGLGIKEYYSDVAGGAFSPESMEIAIVAGKKANQ